MAERTGYELQFLVPVQEWEQFKEDVETIWFEDDPSLTRHTNGVPAEYRGEYEAFSFSSRSVGDLRMIWYMLPIGSLVSDDHVTDLVERYSYG